MKLLQLNCIKEPPRTREPKSLLVFAHGAPDSPLIFSQYFTKEEQQKEWLYGRGIYTLAFPNSRTNPVLPSLLDLARQRTFYEFAEALMLLIVASPTNKIIIIAHDFGCNHAWVFVKNFTELANKHIEKFIALSVGSSFRYDIFEHKFQAFKWLYSSFMCLPFYFPYLKGLQWLVYRVIKDLAGYRSTTKPNQLDYWHYWYGPFNLLRLPFDLVGITYTKEFLDFKFPVLFIRSPDDSIASTRKFEEFVQSREDCVLRIFDYPEKHWFPENRPEETLHEIRQFFAMSSPLSKTKSE